MEHPLNIYLTAGSMISSLGFSTAENMRHIRDYCSGIHKIDDKDLFAEPFMGGQIDNVCLQEQAAANGLENYTRTEQIFLLTIQNVIRESGIDPTSPDCALILSTTKGNINASLPEMGERIAEHFGMGEPILISSACISGVSALIIASRLIRNGEYKHVIVAGGDTLSRFVVTGFQSFKSVSPEICRPYDQRRDGLSLGEACGALLVTSCKERVGESVPIVIEGGAISNDANHISGPSRTGDGLYEAISQAMAANGLQADDISFVNAHGTATVYNDEMESKAIHLAGLENKPLNSLKPYWGHTLGASGLIESIACIEQLSSGELFGTLGYELPGVPYPLQINSTHQRIDMKRCMKTASGFGGCNAAIVLALEPHARPVRHETVLPHSISSCSIRENKIIQDGEILFRSSADDDFATFIRAAYKSLALDDRKFYKMDDLCKLGYLTATCLLNEKNFSGLLPQEVGIILANHSASLDTDLRHQQTIDTLGDVAASPAIFVYTLPNVVMGEICIRHKIKGENTFFISDRYDRDFLLRYARLAMEAQHLKACLIGWCELIGNTYESRFELLKR